jgi:hypothetical protein
MATTVASDNPPFIRLCGLSTAHGDANITMFVSAAAKAMAF